MEFSIKTAAPEKLPTACVVVGVYEQGKLSEAAKTIDRAAMGHVIDILGRGDLNGKPGSSLLLHDIPGISAKRLLLIGLGKEQEFKEKAYLDALAFALRKLDEIGVADALLCLTDLEVEQRAPEWKLRQACLVAETSTYRFDHLKSKKDTLPGKLTELHLHASKVTDPNSAALAVEQGRAIAAGVALAKDLGNYPSNICTPSYLAGRAKELATQHRLSVQILDRSSMEKLGMGSLLSVARGSHEPPRFIVMHHKGGGKKQAPIVLVGKGITFDTGGISLKPGAEMDEMKFDMCGAASVFGAMKAAALLKLPINIVGLVPATENMPGGSATKPGDVVTSLSGQTIEILNTDAEGRLILCDALTYAERFEPDCVIDIATLTGACVIALGHVATGLLTNDDALGAELLAAGQTANDRAWQLPLWEDYQEQLKSNFADMANIGGRPAGAITAASFLARFAKKFRWAHLDIAGTAWRSGKEKGATGRPVGLLTQFLIARSALAEKAAKKPRARKKT